MELIEERFKVRRLTLPTHKPKYQILSTDNIIADDIDKLIRQTKEIFEGVSAEDCQKLLYDFNWDFNGLLEKFSEADSYDDFLEKNKIDLTVPLESDDMVNSFIYSSPLFKWCPNECKKAVKIDSSDVEEVICECGYTFCFKCNNVPHSPFPCRLIKEWIKLCKEFQMIFEENDVICPGCDQFYEIFDAPPHQIFTCIRCGGIISKLNNLLIDSPIFQEYNDYITLSNHLEAVMAMKSSVKGIKDAEFISTVFKYAQHILERALPLPLFSFFLDKDYLIKNPSTANAQIFDFSQDDLGAHLQEFMKMIQFAKGKADSMFSDEQKDKILDKLEIIQKPLEKLLSFIKTTEGWIFKLPEIQEIFDKICEDENEKEEDNDLNDTMDVESSEDETEEDEEESAEEIDEREFAEKVNIKDSDGNMEVDSFILV